MKKLIYCCFAMLLAAGLVSCGENKNKGINELTSELTTVLQTTITGLNEAQSSEDMLNVIKKFVADEAAVTSSYSEDVLSEFLDKSGEELEQINKEYAKAHNEFVNTMYNNENKLNYSDKDTFWETRHSARVL